MATSLEGPKVQITYNEEKYRPSHPRKLKTQTKIFKGSKPLNARPIEEQTKKSKASTSLLTVIATCS